jgi:hypothetical protein
MGATGIKPPADSEYALPPRAQFFCFCIRQRIPTRLAALLLVRQAESHDLEST